jgi:hypothetical protein
MELEGNRFRVEVGNTPHPLHPRILLGIFSHIFALISRVLAQTSRGNFLLAPTRECSTLRFWVRAKMSFSTFLPPWAPFLEHILLCSAYKFFSIALSRLEQFIANALFFELNRRWISSLCGKTFHRNFQISNTVCVILKLWQNLQCTENFETIAVVQTVAVLLFVVQRNFGIWEEPTPQNSGGKVWKLWWKHSNWLLSRTTKRFDETYSKNKAPASAGKNFNAGNRTEYSKAPPKSTLPPPSN